jgi:hypothetical protein
LLHIKEKIFYISRLLLLTTSSEERDYIKKNRGAASEMTSYECSFEKWVHALYSTKEIQEI